jgi:hypothetical protein
MKPWKWNRSAARGATAPVVGSSLTSAEETETGGWGRVRFVTESRSRLRVEGVIVFVRIASSWATNGCGDLARRCEGRDGWGAKVSGGRGRDLARAAKGVVGLDGPVAGFDLVGAAGFDRFFPFAA